LEAMQEYQITVNGVRHDLERPLFVLATQNPIEQEGTYPLPEAQLDRFMFNIVIDYPSAEEERRILTSTTGSGEPVITPEATAHDIEAMRHLVRDVPAASNVIDYALRLVRASRSTAAASPRRTTSGRWRCRCSATESSSTSRQRPMASTRMRSWPACLRPSAHDRFQGASPLASVVSCQSTSQTLTS